MDKCVAHQYSSATGNFDARTSHWIDAETHKFLIDVNHGNRSFRPGYFSPYFQVINAFQMYYYSSFYKP